MKNIEYFKKQSSCNERKAKYIDDFILHERERGKEIQRTKVKSNFNCPEDRMRSNKVLVKDLKKKSLKIRNQSIQEERKKW